MQVGVMAGVGKAFGLTILQSVRAGLLLAAGGEFAFVTFGEAVSHKILPQALVSKLFLIVSLSMALTPFLAEFGQRLGKMFEKSDFKVIIPSSWTLAACSSLDASDATRAYSPDAHAMLHAFCLMGKVMTEGVKKD